MTELNHTGLIHNKVAGPGVAEIVTPDLILVIDDNRILYTLLRYSFFDLRNILFVIDSRSVHADDDESVLRVFIIKLFDVRHGLSTERTIPRPKIDKDNFAA